MLALGITILGYRLFRVEKILSSEIIDIGA